MIFIFILAFIFRGVIFFNFPIIIKDIEWIALGKILNQGFLLYDGVWDNIPPLGGGLYWFLYNIFGDNPIYYHIFSTLLMVFQAFIFNSILINHRCFKHNTYIPALIYIILSSLHLEMTILSPVQLSVTFLLFAIHNVFHHIKDRKNIIYVLRIGVFLGLSQLCFVSTYLFTISLVIFFILVTGINVKHFIIVFFGFMLPQILVFTFFFLKNGFLPYFYTYYYEILNINLPTSLKSNIWLCLLIIPLFLIWNSFRIIFKRRFYNSQQINYQQFLMFWLLISFLALIINSHDSPHQIHITVPFTTFFICIYIINIKKRLWAEAVFILFLASITYLFYLPLNYKEFQNIDVSIGQIQKEDILPFEGEKVLNLSSDISVIKKNNASPPFLNPKLYLSIVEKPEYYKNILLIYKILEREKPSIILADNIDILNKFAEHITLLHENYTLKSKKGIFYFEINQN